jgi:hypothetical protein
LYVAVGFELQGSEFIQIPSMSSAEIASRSFIQFDDISAKFTTTARVSGDMDIASIGNIAISNATIAFGLGLGLVEVSDKIYFSDIASVLTSLAESVEWQKVAAMDATIPIDATIEFASGLGLTLTPVISITSSDMFASGFPSIGVDLNIE